MNRARGLRGSDTHWVVVGVLALLLAGLHPVMAVAGPGVAPVPLTAEQQLGKRLFFDQSLSTPPGQACAACHAPEQGFTNPEDDLPVSRGAHRDRFGNRNDMPAAYAGFGPPLHFDPKKGGYVGGNFWDGRAANLVEQAKGPFTNPLEMANPDPGAVVEAVRRAEYARLFTEVYGKDALREVGPAYERIARALAAYEMSVEVNPFSSKYDRALQGKAQLSEAERRGLMLFNDPQKGNCAACHPGDRAPDGTHPLFTDFSYDNLGVPKNPENPFYYLPKTLNPEGVRYVDRGLGDVVKKASENGKFRVPSLRNVTRTAPYMHNGVFKTLRQVIMFYSTRDVGPWPPPEVAENVNREELGDLKLTSAEIDDLLAFLRCLTDGYTPSP